MVRIVGELFLFFEFHHVFVRFYVSTMHHSMRAMLYLRGYTRSQGKLDLRVIVKIVIFRYFFLIEIQTTWSITR